MSKLFRRALQIIVVAVFAAFVITEGPRTGWPPKLFAAVLAMIAVAFLVHTLSFIVGNVLGKTRGLPR